MQEKEPKEGDIVRIVCFDEDGEKEIIGRYNGHFRDEMDLDYVKIGEEIIFDLSIKEWKILR